MSAKLARIEEQERLLAEKMAEKLNSEDKKRKDFPSEVIDEKFPTRKKNKKTSDKNIFD